MNSTIIGLFGILLLFVVVGNYSGKRVASIEDYYVSGRNAGTLLLTGTLVASGLSTVMWTGDAGFVYGGYFMLDVIFVAMQAQGHCYGTLFYGRYIRRSKALTVADFFGKRFSSKRTRCMIAIVAIIACMSYMISVTQGINLIFSDVTGINYTLCLIITWAIYTSFTVFSGSKGVVLTDTLMFILFFIVAIIMFPFVITASVGEFSLPEVFRQLADFGAKPGVASYTGMLTEDWLSTPFEAITWQVLVGIAWILAIMVSPWQAGRHLMAKNEHTILRTGVLSCILMFGIQAIVFFGAVAINLVNPDIVPEEDVMIWASNNLMPKFMGVLLLAGIVSAGLSSTSTFLSIIGFSIVRDLMGYEEEGKKALSFNRWAMLITGTVVLIICIFCPLNVFWISVFAGTTIAASIAVASLGSIWSKKLTEKAAFWSMVIGLGIKVVLTFMSNFGIVILPSWIDAFFPAFIASLLAAIIISKFTSVTGKETEYRKMLHVIPEEEKDPREMKRTIKYTYLLVGFGIFLMIFMLFAYALPYNGII